MLKLKLALRLVALTMNDAAVAAAAAATITTNDNNNDDDDNEHIVMILMTIRTIRATTTIIRAPPTRLFSATRLSPKGARARAPGPDGMISYNDQMTCPMIWDMYHFCAPGPDGRQGCRV